MQTWQVLMENGNTCFNAKSWIEAEECYQKAIDHIRRQWDEEPENFELLMGWICGQHSLAALYEAQGQHYAALRYLTMPHRWIMALLREESTPESLRALVTRVVKATLTPLLEFSQRHPICDSCYEELQISPEWLANSNPVIH